MKIILRVDADNEIGMGHYYRALNLATELIKNKNKVIFLTKSKIVKNLLPKKIDYISLPINSIKKEIEVINKMEMDVVIIDKLEENTKTIIALKKRAKRVYGIDYIGKNKKDIDWGINILYPKSGINTKGFSSFDYAIINNTFKKSKPIKIEKSVKKILIIQGGSDTHCFTPKILKLFNEFENDVTISVILGPSFKGWRELNRTIKNHSKKIQVFHNVKNMPKILKKQDMAITGGGMTLLELCCLGIPSIVICGENFENETAKLIEKRGFGTNLGYRRLFSETKVKNAIRQLLYDYEIRKKMNKEGRKIIDGKGAERVAKILVKGV